MSNRNRFHDDISGSVVNLPGLCFFWSMMIIPFIIVLNYVFPIIDRKKKRITKFIIRETLIVGAPLIFLFAVPHFNVFERNYLGNKSFMFRYIFFICLIWGLSVIIHILFYFIFGLKQKKERETPKKS